MSSAFIICHLWPAIYLFVVSVKASHGKKKRTFVYMHKTWQLAKVEAGKSRSNSNAW